MAVKEATVMEKIGRSAQQLSPRMRSRLLSAAVAVLRAALLIAVGYAVLSPLLQMSQITNGFSQHQRRLAAQQPVC